MTPPRLIPHSTPSLITRRSVFETMRSTSASVSGGWDEGAGGGGGSAAVRGARPLRTCCTFSAAGLVERFRFGDGQEVRVTEERLEIRPRREVGDVQDGLEDLALQLRRFERRDRALRSHLPESEAAVAIDCLLTDEILPAIARLETAAGLTPEALREI